MRKPNFFIVGAPKCGTTALAQYLMEHPEVFIPRRKEIFYFNTDINRHDCATMEQYLEYFSDADDRHKAVGEASTFYLYSEDAVPNILRFNPEAQFVVMLRNPVEMAVAYHAEEVHYFHENVRDFATAWHLQTERRAGRSIPATCPDRKLLMYADVCALGTQLDRLWERVGKDRVLVVLLDDLHKQPDRVYRRVLEFLDVDDDGRSEFPVVNPRKSQRSVSLHSALARLSSVRKRIALERNFGVLEFMVRVNTQRARKRDVSPAIKETLVECFRPEIRKVEDMLERDLSDWLTV